MVRRLQRHCVVVGLYTVGGLNGREVVGGRRLADEASLVLSGDVRSVL